MEDEDGLSVAGEEHEVGFPVSALAAIEGVRRALMDGDAVLDVEGGAAAFLASPAASKLGPGEVASPGAVVGALQLGIDEAVDGLAADDAVTVGLALEPADDLLWRPALAQRREHLLAQVLVSLQARA